MLVDVEPESTETLDADSRGRVYLGLEFADADGIEVAVLNRDDVVDD